MSQASSSKTDQSKRKDRFVYPDDRVIEKPFNWNTIYYLLTFLKPYKKTLLPVSMSMMLLDTLVKLAIPFLIGYTVDQAIREPGDVHLLILLVSVVFVLFMLQWVFNFARIRYTNQLGQSVIYDLRKKLFQHVEGLSFQFFDERTEGSVVVRISNDVNRLQNLFTNGIINILMDSLTLIGTIVAMLLINVKLAIAVMIVVPLMFLLSTKMRRKIRRGWQGVRLYQSRMNSHYAESIQGMQVTQTFVQESENQDYFQGLNLRNTDSLKYSTRLSAMFTPLVQLTGSIGTAVLFLYGAYLFQSGAITIGVIVAFSNYIGNFWQPISRLGQVYNQLLRAMASSERIFEYFQERPRVTEPKNAKSLKIPEGKVTFADISFSYKEDRAALKDFSLNVESGETVALVGHTGSGKTTVCNLLTRFYDPTAGKILIDGQDLRDVSVHSLRKQIALVMQDTFLFSETIMENIRYGRLNASDEEVIEAAKAVHADPFIRRLPDGYRTEVEERGDMLSVGQRQLISFARALLANPKILILDEATSSIDTETEMKIQKGMKTLLADRTSFIVAHRLSTIQNADKIVVLDHGKIVEIGNHHSLLKKQGIYAGFVQAQSRFLESG